MSDIVIASKEVKETIACEQLQQVRRSSGDKRTLTALLAIAIIWTMYMIYCCAEFLVDISDEFELSLANVFKLAWWWIYFILSIIIGLLVMVVLWFKSN